MLIPVILSGGVGARLWPVSREGHPKPFMKLADGESLLQKTYQRAQAVIQKINNDGDGLGEILTITNRDYYFISKDELSKVKSDQIIHGGFLLEPFGRNTAAAVALAAHYVMAKYGVNARLLVLAADHLISDLDGFLQAVEVADAQAKHDDLVTFGIMPNAPETGFGYIKTTKKIISNSYSKAIAVEKFVEKPNKELAEKYVASGQYLWNSGMFCFKVESILRAFDSYSQEIADKSKQCWQKMSEQKDEVSNSLMLEIPAEFFTTIPDISIDYAVMEKSDHVAVVPSNFGWSDIGSWNAISRLVKPDENGNRAIGDVVFVGGKNNFVQSEDKLVATVGVDDLLIIDTPDALLVAHPDQAQDVKKVVEQLKIRNHDAYKLHKTVCRPWGSYTVLEDGVGFKIKRIEVKPGASLSLQMHHHRSEHWIVVSGMGKVINGEQEIFVSANQSTYIPAGHKHRLENPGIVDLVMIEVQSGTYLGEDDIVRFQDHYGRV